MSQAMLNVKFINSKRQPQNLRRILYASKMKTSQKLATKCKDSRCGTCPYLKLGPSFNFRGKEIHVNSNMSCNINCAGCNKFYIGETGTRLRARIRVHKQHFHVPEYRKIKLSEHIDVCGHGQFQVFPFYKLLSDNVVERREKENYFIQLFKPSLNSLS